MKVGETLFLWINSDDCELRGRNITAIRVDYLSDHVVFPLDKLIDTLISEQNEEYHEKNQSIQYFQHWQHI